MNSKDQSNFIDSDIPNTEQCRFAIAEAQKAGFQVTESRWMGSVYRLEIDSSPKRVLCLCFRDMDYWVALEDHQMLWPAKGEYGFEIDGAFRKALHVFITGQQPPSI
jgi:hypothetical protein